jgi:hypothetical protein
MKLKFITQLLVATLALSGIIMSTTRAQAKSDKAGNGEIESSQVKEYHRINKLPFTVVGLGVILLLLHKEDRVEQVQ